MSEPLKYKAEKAISSYLSNAALSALSGWNHYQGQNPTAVTLPCVLVYATSMVEAFPNGRQKNVGITVCLESAIDADADADSVHGETADRTTNFTAHRAALAAVEAALEDAGALKAHANKGNITTRPVSDFYVYDIQEVGQSSEYAERNFGSKIMLNLVCESQDN